MSLTRRTRAAVAVVTALLLLLCQTAYAARACVTPVVTPDAAAAAPCHGEGETTSDPAPLAAHGACEAAKAPADGAKIHVYAPGELTAVAVAYTAATTIPPESVPQTVHAVCYSPPLTQLHCRFLN